MAIDTHCPNGHVVRVKEHLAGRPVRCPTCATKFRVAAWAHLPLARLVPLAPEVVATLPRARPLGAGTRPPTSQDRPDGPREAARVLDTGSPATVGRDAVRPETDQSEWHVVESDFPALQESENDAAEHEVVSVEMVPEAVAAAAEGQPTELHAVIAERPELTWCIAFPGGDPTEPLDAATMQAWLDGGHATGTEVVWRSDWPEWRPVQDVFPGFFAGGFRF